MDVNPAKNSHDRLELSITNDLVEIDRVNEAFEGFAEKHSIPMPIVFKVKMVFDEVLNNVISYAYEDEQDERTHAIDIEIGISSTRLLIQISDDGKPFNPFGAGAPDTKLALDERELGSLGIHLVRSVMDEAGYHRKIGRNIVTLAKNLEI